MSDLEKGLSQQNESSGKTGNVESWQPIRNQEVNAASAMSGSNDSAAAYSSNQPTS